MTPRAQHEHAQEQEQKAQQRLDEARRELNRQRRELDGALRYDHPDDERKELHKQRLEPARDVFRQRLAQLEQARRERETLFDAIPDKTDEDGGKFWAWQGQRQLPAQAQ